MKRKALVRHFSEHHVELRKHGKKYDLYWNPTNKKVTAVPRHTEIKDILVSKICRIWVSTDLESTLTAQTEAPDGVQPLSGVFVSL